jgi:uncharacterized protein
MFKRLLAVCLTILLLVSSLPAMAQDVKEDFAVQFAKDLVSGDKNAELYELFTDEVKAQLPLDAFSALWPQLTVMCGSFEDLGSLQTQDASGLKVYLQRLNMAKQDLIMQLSVNDAGKIAGINFVPAPKEEETAPKTADLPEGIVEEEVTVGEGEWALPGTLTLPKTGSKFKAVVLVHGSGANDRNETVGSTKMFRDLAWKLAQNGIAVLRYDKRTFVHGSKITPEMQSTFTVREETVDDALLASKLLASDSRIESKKIFLVGHSLGAMLGPRIVSESNGLFSGMVLISGTPLSLTDIVIAQNYDILSKLTEEQRAAEQPKLDAELQKLDAFLKMSAEEAKAATVFGMPGYYLYEMRKYDPAALVLELKLPTLIMQGGKDFQVPVENGLDEWKKAVGDQEFVTYKLYPELNHPMMAYTGDPALQYTLQEYNTPANMDEMAENDIINWIASH